MTPEEQRIAVAQACGWTRKSVDPDYPLTRPEGRWELKDKVVYHYGQLPDYLNDLNAMHEAEKVLNADQCAEYVRYLALNHPTFCILPSEESDKAEVRYQYFSLINATAAQRAEAFLKTLNLWKQ